MTTFLLALLACLALFCTTYGLDAKDDYLYVNITILQSATVQGAVCLDGSPPAYHLDRGHATGLNNWIIYLDGGSWCDSIPDCLDRSTKLLGSSNHMKQRGFFAGILHNTSKQNPEFYNWNRVRVKYCDGSSFTGDVEQVHPENKLYFRGARIFKAIMEDLWSKGMKNAENAILSGTSAGGLATILNCDKFKCLLPESARVKCVADAAFFINRKTIYGTSYIQEMYQKIVNLHGSAKNLPSACTSVMEPSLCFFPQNVVPYIQTPLFIINSIYDSWQINNTLVPLYLDPQHAWKDCINNISRCTSKQRILIQAFGVKFLKTFDGLPPCCTRGYFLTSCYSHGDLRFPTYWFSTSSPRLLNKTIAEVVADWYFERAGFQHKDPYPCARDCNKPDTFESYHYSGLAKYISSPFKLSGYFLQEEKASGVGGGSGRRGDSRIGYGEGGGEVEKYGEEEEVIVRVEEGENCGGDGAGGDDCSGGDDENGGDGRRGKNDISDRGV
ncbi:pectin acetylesterase 8-like [Solanum dulcamara]|uniref:pectin acetylesterase 8-like n=1 Tax=Solanum dulcamara TaxID=45834 RepID=UPI002485A728|nr:pectin acetylesterase 8-like [Solanum dulcamara]